MCQKNLRYASFSVSDYCVNNDPYDEKVTNLFYDPVAQEIITAKGKIKRQFIVKLFIQEKILDVFKEVSSLVKVRNLGFLPFCRFYSKA